MACYEKILHTHALLVSTQRTKERSRIAVKSPENPTCCYVCSLPPGHTLYSPTLLSTIVLGIPMAIFDRMKLSNVCVDIQ